MISMDISQQIHSGDATAFHWLFISTALLIALIFSLFNIKIWRFKQSLALAQTSTKNVWSNKNRKSVIPRQNKSKEKSLKHSTQQIADCIEIRGGVYRSCREEEFVIVRSATLPLIPSIRLSNLSKSESSLTTVLQRVKRRQRGEWCKDSKSTIEDHFQSPFNRFGKALSQEELCNYETLFNNRSITDYRKYWQQQISYIKYDDVDRDIH